MSEELYGANAVTGSAEDAEKALEGREVEITTGDTQKVTVGEKTAEPKAHEAKPNEEVKDGEQPPNEEQAMQEDINGYQTAEADLRNDLNSKGLDFDQIQTEFENNGELSQNTLDALDKAGYPKSVVDAYISGLEATVDRFVSAVHSMAGGEAEFNKLAEFIKSEGKGAIETFNKTLETGDLGQLRAVMDGFRSRMVSKRGTSNRSLLGGGGSTGNVVTGFATKDEMVAAMSDKRYARDPVYTNEVQNKVMHSNFLK